MCCNSLKGNRFKLGFVLWLIGLFSVNYESLAKSNEVIPADDPNFHYVGRIDYSNPKAIRFSHPGISISARFESSFCIIRLKNQGVGKDEEGNPWKNQYQIIIDGVPSKVLGVADGQSSHRIDLGSGEHTITIYKRTESSVGEGIFEGLEIEKGKKLIPYSSNSRLKIEFIGNSITCGYGNEGESKDCRFSPETENNYLAYGSITARALNAEHMTVAFSGKGVYQNYDTTDKTTFPKLYGRILPFEESNAWNFGRWTPDLVVINLGTNDFAHVAPPQEGFVSEYVNFLKTVRNNYPKAKIVCALGPMMTDYWPPSFKALTTAKKYIERAVAEFNDPRVKTFYFTPQSAEDFGCDFHPNVNRHRKMSEELVRFLTPFLKD